MIKVQVFKIENGECILDREVDSLEEATKLLDYHIPSMKFGENPDETVEEVDGVYRVVVEFPAPEPPAPEPPAPEPPAEEPGAGESKSTSKAKASK